MNVTFRCPRCDRLSRVELGRDERHIACSACQATWPLPEGASQEGKLQRCWICPSTELFVRKDFSQSLGVAIVAAGAIVSSFFWALRMPLWTYGVLFATALIDVALYITVGDLLQCYRCHAQYRDLPGLDTYADFDLETHEKHRQQRIRLTEQSKPT